MSEHLGRHSPPQWRIARPENQKIRPRLLCERSDSRFQRFGRDAIVEGRLGKRSFRVGPNRIPRTAGQAEIDYAQTISRKLSCQIGIWSGRQDEADCTRQISEAAQQPRDRDVAFILLRFVQRIDDDHPWCRDVVFDRAKRAGEDVSDQILDVIRVNVKFVDKDAGDTRAAPVPDVYVDIEDRHAAAQF